ncbi:hypothetical protein M8494_29670 [Serratia ureilytica]
MIARVRACICRRSTCCGVMKPFPGLFDFALYFHNYRQLLAKGSGPYLPAENPVLGRSGLVERCLQLTEDRFDLPRHGTKATVLIETLPAVFQMDEILYHLRDHIVGLNCGRWDYIFSYIKTLKNHGDRVLPDRQSVTMEKPFLSAYSRLLIKTCHKRRVRHGRYGGVYPEQRRRETLGAEQVRADKELEASNGHDGTWVAHPGLADTVMEVFGKALGDRQTSWRCCVSKTRRSAPHNCWNRAMASVPSGMRANIRVAVQYIEAWISGNGCVPIYGLMEDAATAEISRTSIWQWIHHEKS